VKELEFLREGIKFLREGNKFLREGNKFLREGNKFLREGIKIGWARKKIVSPNHNKRLLNNVLLL